LILIFWRRSESWY